MGEKMWAAQVGYTMKEGIESFKLSYDRVDRWKNGEVVAKKEQFLIQIWKNEGIQFWHANFKKGWNGVNLRIWKRAGGYLGLDKKWFES